MFLPLLVGLSPAQATETMVVICVPGKDAMLIGTSMEGPKIVIGEVESGTILAQGRTREGTGNPVTVLTKPREPGIPLSAAFIAKFAARLDLGKPTFVSIEALAPYSQRQALITVSTQLWLLSGQSINRDGVILEIPGLAADVLYQQASERFHLSDTSVISITTNAVMMCGCPITPGGMWDTNRYEIHGIVKHNGIPIEGVPLAYANTSNTVKGSLTIGEPGVDEIHVYAFDQQTGNTGGDSVAFRVKSLSNKYKGRT